MFVVYFFLSYLFLAVAIPVGWSLVPLWRRTRRIQKVSCPEIPARAIVRLDPWYAVKMHALGERELRVESCSEWPRNGACGRRCLAEIAAGESAPVVI